MKTNTCNCSGGQCCSTKKNDHKITIEFLYLDLSVCDRCQGTDGRLTQAINAVSNVVGMLGYEIELKKVNINTEELANEFQFVSSPTIRINGKDIAAVKETVCESCGDLCGDTVECRVWEYEGQEYHDPPVALLVDAILKVIYGDAQVIAKQKEYVIPENLKNFYAKMKQKC